MSFHLPLGSSTPKKTTQFNIDLFVWLIQTFWGSMDGRSGNQYYWYHRLIMLFFWKNNMVQLWNEQSSIACQISLRPSKRLLTTDPIQENSSPDFSCTNQTLANYLWNGSLASTTISKGNLILDRWKFVHIVILNFNLNKNQVLELLYAGLIQYSASSFSSPVLVKKAFGNWLSCLKRFTNQGWFSYPTMHEPSDELYVARWFSKFDLRARYDQIRMDPVDIYRTTFRSHETITIFSSTFWLFSTPTTFQAIMNLIFKTFLGKFVINSFSNILVLVTLWKIILLIPDRFSSA